MTNHNRLAVAGAWLGTLVVGITLFYHLRDQPFFYDARAYVDAAEGIRAHGLLYAWPFADLRTYGYPLVLSVALTFSDALHIGPSFAIFGVQWTLFVGAAWLAATALFRDPRTRLLAFLAVAANPLLAVYTAQALTETLTISCILLSTAALGRGYRSPSTAATTTWFAAGAVPASYALAVRPGNLFVPICYGGVALAALLWVKRPKSWLTAASACTLVLAAIAAPLVPQVIVNWHNHHVITALPVVNIAALQSDLGIANIRYATNVAACGEAGIAFASPFAGHDKPGATLGEIVDYYVLSWPQGPETAAMHIFSGLDPRPFLTYQVTFGPGYERALQILTVALLGLACFGAVRAPWARLRTRPDVVFLGAATLFSVAILAVSQTELRFGVVLIVATSLLAAFGGSRIRRPTARVGVAIGAAFAVVLLAWFVVSDLVLATSDAWQTCS